MIVSDMLYGEADIEPVLSDILKSGPVQRLKGINQAGVTKYVKEGRSSTRFSHVVGVMLFLKNIGASLEEQIAGLLHDVPHTAFSHVIDFVFENENHEYHEKFHEKIIMESEIPSILRKHGYDAEDFLHASDFGLLERDLPNLCADRIDYTLRDASAYFGLLDRMKGYIDSFSVYKGEIIMDDGAMARSFGEDYLRLDYECWSDPLEITVFMIAADAIKAALESGEISHDDLFETDDFVFSLLKSSGNEKVRESMEKLNPNLKIKIDEDDYDFVAKSKLRYIDPKFSDGGRIKRASTAFPDFKKKIREHNRIMRKGFPVKIVSW